MNSRAGNRGHGRRLFPVGVYAALLLALLALLRPREVAVVERLLHAVVALPFRAYGGVMARPAAAAGPAEADPASARAAERTAEFWRRVEDAERRARPAQIPAGLRASPCRVLGTSADRTRAVLDVPNDALDGAAGFVTVGDHLVGFLAAHHAARPGAPAEVRLLASPRPSTSSRLRGVPAECVLDAAARPLRFVVEAAAAIDPWPLRCTLLDDPYRAAQLDHDGQTVTTAPFADDPLGPVPAGLRIGTLRIWGYEREDRVLPIGFFVEPFDVVGQPLVTLWRAHDAEPPTPTRLRRVAVHTFGLTAGRWFLALPFAAARIADGAAVVRGDRLLGIVTSAGPGFALARTFGAIGAEWDLLALPREAGGAPLRIKGSVIDASERAVMLALPIEQPGLPLAAHFRLFSSSVRTPAGLFVGDARTLDAGDGRRLLVERASGPGASGAAIEILMIANGGGSL